MDANDKEVTYLMRILIVGNTDVGKTSLLVRFNEDKFVRNQRTTIGVDYKAREMFIGTVKCKLQIWDTAGQERFRSMTSAFYNKASGVILVFDVCQKESFDALPAWLEDIKRDAPEGCNIVLCANKVDMEADAWQVSRSQFADYARRENLEILETSGKSGENVTELFVSISAEILRTGMYAMLMRVCCQCPSVHLRGAHRVLIILSSLLRVPPSDIMLIDTNAHSHIPTGKHKLAQVRPEHEGGGGGGTLADSNSSIINNLKTKAKAKESSSCC